MSHWCLPPTSLRRPPLWQEGENCLSTEEVWNRIRKEPELPMVLKATDLLPTFRAGVATSPDALWVYYVRPDKKVYGRGNASELAPAISAAHFLYDTTTAIADRIIPVKEVRPQELWDHLWPKAGATPNATVAATKFLDAARTSPHFPVLPDRAVLWQALQEGARENRWVLYLRGPNLAIGAQEMIDWPGTARFEESVEFWTYQAALEQGIYPRKKPGTGTNGGGERATLPLSATKLKEKCWPSGAAQVASEVLERYARSIWSDLSRPRLETVFGDGVRDGLWCAWKKDGDETFYTRQDAAAPDGQVSPGSPTGQTVYIPKTNVVSVEEFRVLLFRFSRKERIPYVA